MWNKNKTKLFYIIADIIVLVLMTLVFVIMIINDLKIWQPITVAAIFSLVLWETIYYIKAYKNIVCNPNNMPYIIFNFILIVIVSYAGVMFVKEGFFITSIMYLIGIIYLFKLNLTRIKLYKNNKKNKLL